MCSKCLSVLIIISVIMFSTQTSFSGKDSLPTKDSKYISIVSSFVSEKVFKDKTDEVAYSYAKEQNMHYLYVAFLDLFPQSKYASEISKRTEHFGILSVPDGGSKFFSDKELKEKYNFNGVMEMYRWGGGLSAMEITESGSSLITGHMCLGNLQLFSGGFSAEVINGVEGLKLLPGTKIIYPLKKMKEQ